jgi:hypothetical protein
MKDGFYLALVHQADHGGTVLDVGPDQFDAADGGGVSVGEIVDDDGRHPGTEQRGQHVATNITGPTTDKNIHGHKKFLFSMPPSQDTGGKMLALLPAGRRRYMDIIPVGRIFGKHLKDEYVFNDFIIKP